MLAEVHLSLHDFDKALDHGGKAYQLNPNDPRVSSVYGEILIRTGNLNEGIKHLEKAYELDPIPQGQSTSDRRIYALLTGYYFLNNIDKCNELINTIIDLDFKSWLLSYDIFTKNDHEVTNKSWFTKGLQKFSNFDVDMEVDRFHLNNNNLQSELISTAKQLLNY
jgi:tetratricopeptide (TPR) repeat protein